MKPKTKPKVHYFRAKHWLEGQLQTTVSMEEFLHYFGITKNEWYDGRTLKSDPNWLTPNRAFHCARQLRRHPREVMDELDMWSVGDTESA
ncbi:MAG TPA: hypothetical protein VF299_03745 [Mycobacterium sp.]